MRIGGVAIDIKKRVVTVDGDPVKTTATEFELLQFLLSNPGRTFSRSQLLEEIWGYSPSSYEANLNAHINRLRRKIEEDTNNPRYILTVRGIGYRFAEPGDLESQE